MTLMYTTTTSFCVCVFFDRTNAERVALLLLLLLLISLSAERVHAIMTRHYNIIRIHNATSAPPPTTHMHTRVKYYNKRASD